MKPDESRRKPIERSFQELSNSLRFSLVFIEIQYDNLYHFENFIMYCNGSNILVGNHLYLRRTCLLPPHALPLPFFCSSLNPHRGLYPFSQISQSILSTLYRQSGNLSFSVFYYLHVLFLLLLLFPFLFSRGRATL